VISYGLIAGMTLAETLASPPGLVFDLFRYRERYDDVLHRIRRKKEAAYE